jgi:hypothetical protein
MTVRFESGERAFYVGERWLGTHADPSETDPAEVAEVLNAMCRHLGMGTDRLLEFRGGAFGSDFDRAAAFPFVCLDGDPARPVLLPEHFKRSG